MLCYVLVGLVNNEKKSLKCFEKNYWEFTRDVKGFFEKKKTIENDEDDDADHDKKKKKKCIYFYSVQPAAIHFKKKNDYLRK